MGKTIRDIIFTCRRGAPHLCGGGVLIFYPTSDGRQLNFARTSVEGGGSLFYNNLFCPQEQQNAKNMPFSYFFLAFFLARFALSDVLINNNNFLSIS